MHYTQTEDYIKTTKMYETMVVGDVGGVRLHAGVDGADQGGYVLEVILPVCKDGHSTTYKCIYIESTMDHPPVTRDFCDLMRFAILVMENVEMYEKWKVGVAERKMTPSYYLTMFQDYIKSRNN